MKQQSIEFLDFFSRGYDTLYREGLDGYIGVKLTADEQEESGKKLELVTIIDLTTLWETKQQMAREIGDQLQSLHHENLLNLIRPIKYESTHVDDGLMIFSTEAPDHRLSWKSFCKLPYDLEQIVSIFR